MNATPEFEVMTMRNGTRAIRHRESGEVMHPGAGPWEEANDLYVSQSGLTARLEAPGASPLRIWDVGLGGGANAIAALTAAVSLPRRRRALEILSFDRTLEPLVLAAGAPDGFPFLEPWRDAIAALVRDGEWKREDVAWRVIQGDLRAGDWPVAIPPDLVFFDPFSPVTNPELWTVPAFAALRTAVSGREDGTLLLTYSSSTRTRASLLAAGFFVGSGTGAGLREEATLAATRVELLEAPLGSRWLERWRRSSSQAPHGQIEPVDLACCPQFLAPGSRSVRSSR